MDEIITKQSDGFQINKFDVQQGQLSAVVTSFKNYDTVNDVIMPGALDKYLKEFDGSLQMLFQHDKGEIIGKWTKFEVKGDLVIGTGEIFPEVSKGSDVMALISRGMVGATSIGFRTSDYEGNDRGGMNFKEIKLVEVSIVQAPANPKAQILSAKNEDGSINLRNLEKALRDAGLSRSESKQLLSDGPSALRDAVEKELKNQNLVKQLQSALRR